jgi:3-hydroxymyristoyl/3-hydroxydecanoyl-(acyl carrier protein) dehydratase
VTLIEPQPLAVRRAPQGADGTSVELDLLLSPDLPYFPDHFPGHPMLPGVVQLGWALHFAAREFGIDVPFRRLNQLKYQHPLQPGHTTTLRLERLGPQEVAFSYRVEARPCSSGRLLYAV